MTELERPPRPDWDTAQKLAELVMSLCKRDTYVDIEIYPIDRNDLSAGYAYEYWETPNGRADDLTN